MQPLISIIIPVYQVEKYLVDCLESVLNQTYINIEVILVDDGSKDRSGRICDEYAKKDKRITVIHKENGGLVSARKAGLSVAKGEMIAYVDSDDYIDRDMYEQMYRIMDETGADIVITGHTEIMENVEKKVQNYISSGVYKDNDRKKVYAKMLYEDDIGFWGLSPACWDKLFKKEKMYRFQMDVDERIWDGEDHAFTYAVILNSRIIAIDNKTPYHHRIRDNSVATGYDEKAFERLSILWQHCKNQFETSEYWNELLKKQFPYWMRWFLYKHIYTELGIPPVPLPSQCYGYVFPFEYIKPDERIILYGAGDVGRDYYRQIITTGYCKVVMWVSRDWESNYYTNLLSEPNKINSCQYEKIVVAVNGMDNAEVIKRYLSDELGISKEVIVWRNPSKKELAKELD